MIIRLLNSRLVRALVPGQDYYVEAQGHGSCTGMGPDPSKGWLQWEWIRGELFLWAGRLHLIWTPKNWSPSKAAAAAPDQLAA